MFTGDDPFGHSITAWLVHFRRVVSSAARLFNGDARL